MDIKKSKKEKAVLEDSDIIELYFARDENAITQTDIKYKKYLFAVAHNILNDRLDCEECLSDTYIRTWNSIPPTIPRCLCAFLTAIIRRLAVNRYHANMKKSSVPSEMTVALSEIEAFTESGISLEEEFDTRHLAAIISKFLKGLPARRRYIFMSRYYGANTVQKIANDLELSRSSINKELYAIRQELKITLEKEGYFI